MSKITLMAILLFSTHAFANTTLTPNYFVGKWQCQTKNNDPNITQRHEFHFLKNGHVTEHIHVTYGQKTAYDYQIETAISKSQWQVNNDTLIYPNYRIYNYKVQMPNSKKDDIHQATIAIEKSLPIIQAMMDNPINQRQFDISLIDKKSFLMNDMKNEMFMTCHKKSVLSNLF